MGYGQGWAPPSNTVGGGGSSGTASPKTVAKLTLLNQTTTLSVNLYTVPAGAGGLYRLSCYAYCTIAGGVTGQVGGAGLQMDSFDFETGNGILTNAANPSLTLPSNNVGQTYEADTVAACQAGAPIFALLGYGSTGAPAMAYNVHFTVEYISPLP